MPIKRLEALDVLKYTACLFVILIHTDIPQTAELIIQPILTTAVPIFFMITGFFYSETVKAGRTKKQLQKIAVLALVANLVHIGWACLKCLLGDRTASEFVAEIIDPTSLVNLLVFNQPIWRTSIWYINALLVLLFLFYAVQKQEHYRKLYWCIPVLLTANLLLGTYSFVFPANEQLLLCYSRNVFFCGIPYFLLGHYVFANRQRLCGAFGKWLWVALFWIAGCLELWLLNRFDVLGHKDNLLSSSFLALTLFCICLKKEFVSGVFWKRIAAFGRKYCFAIYVMHSIILEVFYKIVNGADAHWPMAATVLYGIGPLLVLIVSTLFACAFERVKQRIASFKRP